MRIIPSNDDSDLTVIVNLYNHQEVLDHCQVREDSRCRRMFDPKKLMAALTDLEIQVRAEELGLSTVGTRSTLLELIKEKEAAQLKASVQARDELKKKKRQRRRKKKRVSNTDSAADDNMEDSMETDATVEIEYVPETIRLDPEFAEFSKIFKQFQEPGEEVQEAPVQGLPVDETPDLEDLEDEPEDKPLSKKKMKKLNRPSVAMLKKVAFMPEVVDWVDVTASDPYLLIQLKSTRNTVPVPVHWSQKKRYLGGKRGFEKIPFELPQYIKDTGIMEMRNAMIERDEAAGLKGRTRARMKPKLGRLDIDYQKLHDAFFKYQTKPAMTKYGDMYYEGKEFAANVQLKRPGSLSEELKNALNIPPGAPPPWLLNMQRYGPPPAYPNLKIPGLNAPIPEGAQWGYHPGGWGKPPVDELNRPLYGDVFGMVKAPVKSKISENIDRTLWGELESEPEAEEELEEDEEEDEEMEEEVEETEKPIEEITVSSGIETPSVGTETPTNIELRKRYQLIMTKKSVPTSARPLYTVLPSKPATVSGFMGSSHGYDLPQSSTEISLNPEDLESGIESEMLKRKLESSVDSSSGDKSKKKKFKF